MRLLFYILILILFPMIADGQNFDKIDLRLNLNIIQSIENFDKSYINSDIENYPYKKPTILGNLNGFYSLELATIYSGFSIYFHPELIFRFNYYSVKDNDYYKNLKINTYSLGFGNVINFCHIQRFIISAHLNIFLGRSKLVSDANQTNIRSDDGISFLVNYGKREIYFINPSIEIGLMARYYLTSRIDFEGRLSLDLTNFPDFDISSPVFYKSFYLGLGVNFRLFMNKRFYY